MHPDLDGAWLTLFNPLFGLLFSFRHVIGNHRLVHRHNVVQNPNRYLSVAFSTFGEACNEVANFGHRGLVKG